MSNIPNPDVIFPNEFKTSCFLKNVITAPNISVGDYTYYDDPADPTGFERNNVLFNYPEFGDRLTIGKFCSIASGVKFIMGPANHRISSVTTYPFQVLAACGRRRPRPTCPSFPSRGTPLWAMMCGSAGRASSCPGCTSATGPSSRPVPWW